MMPSEDLARTGEKGAMTESCLILGVSNLDNLAFGIIWDL
jgi:hypothetical protein